MIKNNIKFSPRLQIKNEEKEYIIKCLPSNFDTEVKEICIEKDYEIFIRINAKTVADIQNWISTYENITKTSYSVETTYKCSGQRILFKRSYHCQHKTRHKHTYDPVYRKSIKNTNCPSIFSVAIRTIKKRYQGKDKSRAPDEEKPCEIRLRLKHNHSTDNSMALKFKKVLPEVKNDLVKLFFEGHTAATALQILKLNIKFSFEDYEDILNDRSKCPDYSYCHYLYQKTLNTEQLEDFNEEFLKKKLDQYNKNIERSKYIFSDNDFVICLCPQFVKRVHQYQIHSSQVVFLDSIPICDKQNGRIYTLTCQNEISALPLGIIITSNNAIHNLCKGFELLKEILGDIAFFGNPQGPQIIFSDEFICENNIISQIFPRSQNLLTHFHVLQNMFKWIHSAKNGISINDKQTLFMDFYNLLYSVSEEDFSKKYSIAVENSNKYKHFRKILHDYCNKKQLWCSYFRSELINNSFYNEFYVRVIKDDIFQKLKSFNIVQILDFTVCNYFRYFKKHLEYISLKKKSTNLIFQSKIYKTNNIQCINNNCRLVASEKDSDFFYLVNTDLLTCSCFNGTCINLCTHIEKVMIQIFYEKLIANQEKCQNFYLIATGNQLDICQTDSVVMDTIDVNIEEYIVMKKNNLGCENNMKSIKEKLENLINDAENFLPALRILYSRFEAVKNVDDICAVFGIDDVGKKSSKNKIVVDNNRPKKRKLEENVNIVYFEDINMLQ